MNSKAREGALRYRDGKDKHLQLSGCETLRHVSLHVLSRGLCASDITIIYPIVTEGKSLRLLNVAIARQAVYGLKPVAP